MEQTDIRDGSLASRAIAGCMLHAVNKYLHLLTFMSFYHSRHCVSCTDCCKVPCAVQIGNLQVSKKNTLLPPDKTLFFTKQRNPFFTYFFFPTTQVDSNSKESQEYFHYHLIQTSKFKVFRLLKSKFLSFLLVEIIRKTSIGNKVYTNS